MSTAPPRSASERNPLRLRLAALRWRLRLVTVFHGACWLVAGVVGVTALACLLDWLTPLPALIRAALLAVTLTGGGILAYRYLLAPLAARTDDLTLALRVEEHYPTLNDALASTIQFLEQKGHPRGDSPAMRLEAVRRAMDRAKNCDFNRVIPTRGVRLAGLSAGLVGAAAVALLVLGWSAAMTALARFTNPFGGVAWPTKTRLTVEVPRDRLGRGELFVLRGRVEGVVPEQGTVLIREDGIPEKTRVVKITHDEDGTGHFEDRMADVRRSFRVQVRANDAESDEYPITVLPPPSLVNGSLRLELVPPKYTGLPSPQKVEPGKVDVEVYDGTRIDLRATADRPLKRAWIEYKPDYPEVARLQAAVTALGGTSPLAAVSLLAAAGAIDKPVPATLGDDRQAFHVRFQPRAAGAYQLVFEDETGLPGQRVITVRLQRDPAPAVRLERPSASRDLLTVLPTAVLTLHVVADDPIFGLRSVFVRYRTNRDAVPRELTLLHPEIAAAQLVSPVAGTGSLAARGVRVSPPRMEFRRPLTLQRFTHADGTPLQEGDTLILQACADDFDDVTPDKQPGCSAEVEIHIVSRNTLEQTIGNEETKVQQQIARANDRQKEATKRVRELENKLKRNEKLTEDDMRQLAEARDKQQEVREQIGDEKQGLRADVDRLRQAMRQNDLRTGAEERMKKVAQELERIANNELERIDPRLADAREQIEMMEERNKEERKKKLEEKAAKAEQAARAKKAEADRLEQEAEKARTQEERQKLREEAEKQRQEAEKLRQQAERTKKEANEAPSPEQPRQALAQARQGQEEVEKTFSDLMARLEPVATTQEIRSEARDLLNQQEKLRAEMEQMQEREKIQGKTPEQLTPEQRRQLEDMREQQQRLEERMKQLLDRMNRMAEERQKQNDPETARELRETREKAIKDNLPGQMKEARDRIAENKLSEAAKAQEKAAQQMREMVKNLEDKREAELDRMRKRLKEVEKKLDELTREQEELQKKMREAKKKNDAEALKALEGEQKRLRAKTKEVMDELKRLRLARAQQALKQADEGMELSRQDLEKGKGDDDKQEDVLDRLDDARREVEQARKQAEEELKREKLRQVAQALTRIMERQETLGAEAERIQKQVQQQQAWTRGLKGSLGNLGDNQKGLAGETLDVTKKELTNTPVFRKLVEKAAEAMQQAGKRLEQLFADQPGADKLPDAELAKQQAEAVRRLKQVLQAINEEANRGEGGNPGAGGGGGDGGGDGGAMGQEERGLPQQAQLKLLIELQAEVKKKTEAFKKAHPDLEKLDEKAQDELEALRKDQQDIYELLDELRKPAGEPGDAEGEKKP